MPRNGINRANADMANQADLEMFMQPLPGRSGKDALERSHGNQMRVAIPHSHLLLSTAFYEESPPAAILEEALQQKASLEEKIARKLAETPPEEQMRSHREAPWNLKQQAKIEKLQIPDILETTIARFKFAQDKTNKFAQKNKRLESELSIASKSLEQATEKTRALQLQSTDDTNRIKELEAAHDEDQKAISTYRRRVRDREEIIKTLQAKDVTPPQDDATKAQREAEVNAPARIQHMQDEITSLNTRLGDMKKAEEERVKASDAAHVRAIADLQGQLDAASEEKAYEIERLRQAKAAHREERESNLAKIRNLEEDLDGLRHQLQSLPPQLKTAQEELRAKNAELETLKLEKPNFDQEKKTLVAQFVQDKGELVSKHGKDMADLVSRLGTEKAELVSRLGIEKAELVSSFGQEKAALTLKHNEEKATMESKSNKEKADLILKLADDKADLVSSQRQEKADFMSKHAEEKAEIASKSNDDMAALILKHAEEKAEFESNSNTEKATLISKHAEEKANLESKSTIEMAELTSRLGQQKVAIVLAFVERREAIESDYQDLAKLYDVMKVQLGMANKDKNRVFALEKENALSKDRVKVARDDYAKLKLQKEALEHRHQTLHSELATAREAAKVEKKKADGGIKRAREEVEATQQRNLSAQSLANDKLERAINAYNTSQEELASCKEELRKVSIAKATAEESLEVTKIDLQEAIEARNTSDTSAKQSKEELGESHADLKTRDATIEENRMRIGNLESELQRTQGRLRYTTREANSQLDTAWRQADDLLGFFNDAYAEVARLREKMEVMVPRKDLEFAEEQFAELQTEHYRLEREFEKLQRQLVDVKKEISDCEVELDPDNNLEIPFETISGLQGELQSLEEANQTLQETNQTLEENMIQLNGSIDRLTLELEERDTKLETASETIKTSNEEQARLQEVFNERQRELQGAKAQAAEANDSLKDSESRSRKLASDNQELTDRVGSLESKLEEQRRSFAVNEAKLKGETVDAKEQILQLNAQLAALRLHLNPLAPLPRPSNASSSSSHSPLTHSPELGEDRLHPSSGPSTSQSPQMLPPAATMPTSRQTPAQNHSRRASSASEASTDAPSPGVGPSRDTYLAPPPQDPNASLEYDFLISGTPKTGQRSNQGPREVIALMDARIEQWTAKTAPSHWSRLSNMNACVNRRVVGIKKKQQGTHEDPDDPKTACTTCVSWKIPCVMAYKGFRPVVLPLPASERAAGVTPADRAYYVKCTENRAGSVS